MEGANEAARRAVNGILDAAKFDGARCDLWPLHEPEILAPWRLHDAGRYAVGLPWDDSLMQVAAHAIRNSSPLLEQARPLLEAVAPFMNPVADALDLTDGSIEIVNELRTIDPAAKAGAPNVQKPNAPRSAVDVVGPKRFLERLGWYRDMLADTLAAGIPRREPQRHLYGLIKDFIDRSGKGLRPALCLATARALGGSAEHALPAAAGLEMLHNAFLVHRDIEDGSESRRGIATMHRRAGIPLAVNIGDAMNALAMRLFRKTGDRLGPAAAMRIFDEVDHLLVETLEGQAIELGWCATIISQWGWTIICGSCSRRPPASFIPCELGHSSPTASTRISVDLTGSAICLGSRSRSPTTFLT
jgi:Polyprenyl synthetase